MGLTIHYKLKFTGTEEEAKKKIEMVRTMGLALLEYKALSLVSPVWDLDYSKRFDDEKENAKYDPKAGGGYKWAKLQCQPSFIVTEVEEGGVKKVMMTSPEDIVQYRGYVVLLWAGAGCESTNIGLISKDGKNWTGQAFTKTQYAHDFVKAHLTVIKVLDFCKAIGILQSVSDEGDYWETRDLKVLGGNINDSTRFIAQMGAVLDKASEGMGLIPYSPIDKVKNFMIVKGGEDNEKRDKKDTQDGRI